MDLLAVHGLIVIAIMCSLSFDFMAFATKIRSRRWRPLEKKDLLVSRLSREERAVGSREQVRAGRGGGGSRLVPAFYPEDTEPVGGSGQRKRMPLELNGDRWDQGDVRFSDFRGGLSVLPPSFHEAQAVKAGCVLRRLWQNKASW